VADGDRAVSQRRPAVASGHDEVGSQQVRMQSPNPSPLRLNRDKLGGLLVEAGLGRLAITPLSRRWMTAGESAKPLFEIRAAGGSRAVQFN
jgi:hypothetical protein